jgi:hypothetical protein
LQLTVASSGGDFKVPGQASGNTAMIRRKGEITRTDLKQQMAASCVAASQKGEGGLKNR